MKISELSTDRALDVLCELTPYVSNVASDEAVVSAVGKVVTPKDTNVYGAGLMLMERMGEIVPLLLKTHRPDVYGVLSVLNDKAVTEIATQPVGDTIRQIKDVFSDNELLDFFKSSARQEKTEPSAPSAGAPT